MIPVKNDNESGKWYLNIRVSKKVPDVHKYAAIIDKYCKRNRCIDAIYDSNRRWNLTYHLPFTKVKGMIKKINQFNDKQKVKYIREIEIGRYW